MLVPWNMTLYFLLNEDFFVDVFSAWMPCLFFGWVVQVIRVIWLVEYFVLLLSLPCKQLCMLSLCWQPFLICRVLVWPSSLPCKQLSVVCCLDEFSWSVECLPGSCLRRINNSMRLPGSCLCRINNSVRTLECLQCSPRASYFLEQEAGGSWLDFFLIHVQA